MVKKEKKCRTKTLDAKNLLKKKEKKKKKRLTKEADGLSKKSSLNMFCPTCRRD